jgi:hypothetical protein
MDQEILKQIKSKFKSNLKKINLLKCSINANNYLINKLN